MNARELIRLLSQYPDDMPVMTWLPDGTSGRITGVEDDDEPTNARPNIAYITIEEDT